MTTMTPEEAREYMRMYRLMCPEIPRLAVRKCKAKNPDKIRESVRRSWRKMYSDPIKRKITLDRQHFYRAENLDKIRESDRNSKRKHYNRESEIERKRKRKAKYLGVAFQDCIDKIRFLRLLPLCRWCFTPIKNFTVDHVVPLARGGSHIPSNLVAACRSCNSSKNDRLLHEWRVP